LVDSDAHRSPAHSGLQADRNNEFRLGLEAKGTFQCCDIHPENRGELEGNLCHHGAIHDQAHLASTATQDRCLWCTDRSPRRMDGVAALAIACTVGVRCPPVDDRGSQRQALSHPQRALHTTMARVAPLTKRASPLLDRIHETHGSCRVSETGSDPDNAMSAN
jgi:hypothetical protein